MYYFLFVCGVLQPILQCYSVNGKSDAVPRFLVKAGAKPAIFGSYSYDPVKRIFVTPLPEERNYQPEDYGPTSPLPLPSQSVSDSFVQSTAVVDETKIRSKKTGTRQSH
ncbi:uncharacterized protein LOC111360533 [Spodoptera litura]|uniref:Uncharacterized protein LOC111360533 n=1 Tax=Spodoptera litura TaxID=69820 RepID=A0A9J7EQE8_SPOLT|nr:uncharacterized protein LOC111360533 [Spodoptera litura]